jgi:hypothetical protein
MLSLVASRRTARSRRASFWREEEDLTRRRMPRTVNRVAIERGGSLEGIEGAEEAF